MPKTQLYADIIIYITFTCKRFPNFMLLLPNKDGFLTQYLHLFRQMESEVYNKRNSFLLSFLIDWLIDWLIYLPLII